MKSAPKRTVNPLVTDNPRKQQKDSVGYAMKDQAEFPRSSGSRIDIGRSLSIGKVTKPTTTIQTNSDSQLPSSSDDAASLQLSTQSSLTVPNATIAQSGGRSIPAPKPITSGREAAKASYLRQSEQNTQSPSPPEKPIEHRGSSGSPPPLPSDQSAPPDISFAELRQRLSELDTIEESNTPRGDSEETLKPYAEKYVDFLAQTGEEFTASQRETKIAEVVEFYSVPTRQGRLQALVQEL